MEEPTEIEHWRRISILGSGAFGVVSLWQHKFSDDYIAIKKCKFQTVNHLSEKQRIRWQSEVEKMQTLNCPNIVSYKPLPKHLEGALLKFNPSKLPLLSMEYCTKGNLRHVLMQPKNLSGMQESDVKVILSDITEAVMYLHRYNITHRDIKPENIVLQQSDTPSGVIYKLIDLGYAKELNDSVVSFVGTLHYLAPEIMKYEKYNHTVDYWSLGVVFFEVICGVLPFLPYFTPMERFPYIEKKKPEHICIYQLQSGSVTFSSEILKENHINSCFKQHFEIWLRKVLQFEPALRKENVFDDLLAILDKRIITVFSFYTLEFYSYEINEGTLVDTLKDWIFRDTKISKNEQILLSELEKLTISDDKYVVDIIPNNFTLIVLRKGALMSRDNFKLPKYITSLFENCVTKYNWRDLRQIYIKVLFFLTQEQKLLKFIKVAFELCCTYIFNLHAQVKDNMQQVYKSVNNILTRVDCYNNLHNNDNNLHQCCDEYKIYLLEFQQLICDLEKSIHVGNNLISKVGNMWNRQLVLDKFQPNVLPVINNCDINDEISRAADLILRSQDVTPKEMVKIVSSALKQKDKLLNNKNFHCYSKAMLVAVKDVFVLKKEIDHFHSNIKKLSVDIDVNQKNQYRCLLTSPKKIFNQNNFKPNSFVHWDTDSVIKENQELRCQLEEILGEFFAIQKMMCEDLQYCAKVLST